MEKHPHKSIGRNFSCFNSANDLGKAVMAARNLKAVAHNVPADRVFNSKTEEFFIVKFPYFRNLVSVEAVSLSSNSSRDGDSPYLGDLSIEFFARRHSWIAWSAECPAALVAPNNSVEHTLR